MKMVSVIAVVIISCLLTVDVNITHADVKVSMLDERPRQDYHYKNGGVDLEKINFAMVKGESEGLILRIQSQGEKFVIDYPSNPSAGLDIRLYRIDFVNVPGVGSVGDPLIPIKSGAVLETRSKTVFVYLRLSAGIQAREGIYRAKMRVRGGGKIKDIPISCELLPFAIEKEWVPFIQATIRTMFSTYPVLPRREQRLRIIKRMAEVLSREYHVRSFAGLWGKGNPDLTVEWDDEASRNYFEIVKFCIEELGTERVRLPAKNLFGKRKPLSTVYKDITEDAIIADLRLYKKRLEIVLSQEKWKGKFSMRLWDEPKASDYPEVVLTYKAARKVFPELSLELTKQPDDRFGDIADVWVVHPRFFDEAAAERQRAKGKKIWLYMNKASGMDEPLHGMRVIGWLIWKYRIDGYMFFSMNYWNADPWKESDRMWRGTFLYPDYRGGDVFPSLRLEYFREGIEDAAILKKLESSSASSSAATEMLKKMRNAYYMSEKLEGAPNPSMHRRLLIDILKATMRAKQ